MTKPSNGRPQKGNAILEKMRAGPAQPAATPVAPPAAAPPLRLVTRRASEIEPAAVNWLWPGRLPLGMVSELIGNPGHGKSTITADIAARVSRGLGFPPTDARGRPPADVLYLNAEDAVAQSIRPRLEAAGADLDRVHMCWTAWPGATPRDHWCCPTSST